jgi:hypothetical protein
MSILHFEDDAPKPRRKNKLKIFVAVTAISGVIALGTTLAGRISLNGGGDVEFGQGYLTTTTCDSNGIRVTPVNSFYNRTGPANFTFNAIQIEDVSENCVGYDLIIKVYNESGQALEITTDGDTGYSEARVYFQPFSPSILVSDDYTEPNTVSPSGYWADQFTLMSESPIVVGTLTNLVQLDPDVEVTAGSSASEFFDLDPDLNSFQITFDPSGELATGFADSKNVYHISIQSVDHQS